MAHTQTVSEIPAMTVPTSVIDMDAVGPAGPITLPWLNRGGTNCGGSLAQIALTPSIAPPGTYDMNAGTGRGLALVAGGGLSLLDAPNGTFVGFHARLDFTVACTEFGIAVGDWNGPLDLDFLNGNLLVASLTSTPYKTPAPKFFAMSGGQFDGIDIRAGRSAGNWVITELQVEVPGNSFTPFGRGCPGSNGTPRLAAAPGSIPTIGQPFAVDLTGLPAGPGTFFMTIGIRERTFRGLGNLPFDLGLIGAPGCLIQCDIAVVLATPYVGSTVRWQVALPNSPPLVGTIFYTQAFVLDPPANPLGLTVSNPGRGCVN